MLHTQPFYFLIKVRFPWRGELVYLRHAWRSNSLVQFNPHPGVCRPFELLDLLVEEEMQCPLPAVAASVKCSECFTTQLVTYYLLKF